MGIIPTEVDGQGCIEGVYMTALVGLIMGSDSDWVTVEPTVEVLAEFGIPFEVGVVSAHRTPEKMRMRGRQRILLAMRFGRNRFLWLWSQVMASVL